MKVPALPAGRSLHLVLHPVNGFSVCALKPVIPGFSPGSVRSPASAGECRRTPGELRTAPPGVLYTQSSNIKTFLAYCCALRSLKTCYKKIGGAPCRSFGSLTEAAYSPVNRPPRSVVQALRPASLVVPERLARLMPGETGPRQPPPDSPGLVGRLSGVARVEPTRALHAETNTIKIK